MKNREWGGNRKGLLIGVAAIAVALGIKGFYREAGADDLLWILTPSAWLARFAGGIDLAYEPGAGYISHTHHLIVGPACAGVNFLVIAFLTIYFGLAKRFRSRAVWLAASAGIAFGATALTNGLRIFLAAHLYEADIYGGSITPERMHRLLGIALYYASLLTLYLGLDAIVRLKDGVRSPRYTPLLWYVGISIGAPFAGRLVVAGSAGFGEHAAWVASVAALLTLATILPALWRNRIQWTP